MKLSFSILFIFSIILCSAMVEVANAHVLPPPVSVPTPPGVPHYCNSKCDYRCSRNYRKKFCMQLCMTCCKRCDCVPSGPFADKAECPCYRDMKNKKGMSKCP